MGRWGRGLGLATLWLAIVASAVGVVFAKHFSRGLFLEWEGLQRQRDALQVEWGQLQLEESAWSSHSRVESAAREQLGMEVPTPDRIVLVKP